MFDHLNVIAALLDLTPSIRTKNLTYESKFILQSKIWHATFNMARILCSNERATYILQVAQNQVELYRIKTMGKTSSNDGHKKGTALY